MMITGISVSLQNIGLERPFVTALRRVETLESVRVTIHTNEGITAMGEAPPTVAITGESIESITHALKQRIAPLFLQRPLEGLEEALQLLHGRIRGDSSARAAFDIALYDLFSKAAAKPLYAFLGGKAGIIETDITISLGSPLQMAGDAADAVKRGRTLLKVKVGAHDGLDLERIRRIREAAPHATLLVDANQAWTLEESLLMVAELEPLDIALIEQPVPAADIDALKTITRASSIPILADEAAFTLEDVKGLIEAGAADMINIKLMKCGGISKAIEILEYCRSKGIHCMLGSMLEGPLSISAALHLGLAYPDTVRYFDLDSPLLYVKGAVQMPIAIEGNRLSLLSKAGI